jgi:hypothetical protein
MIYVGLSPIRTRYRSTPATSQVSVPAVQAIECQGRRSRAIVAVPGIEQVNNVYLVPTMVTKRLREL